MAAVSVDDLAAIAAGLGVDALPPGWLGANIAFSGIPDFTELPPGARLIFDNGVALAVDMENGPCRFVADVIESHRPGHGAAFPRVARGRRGVTGWVERPGEIALGDAPRLHIPPQRLYAAARRAARA